MSSTYKNVLVTGSSGFLGSHVADELTERGYCVRLVDLVASAYKKTDQEELIGNLRDKDFIAEVTEGIDCVYHFAGMADIAECAKYPSSVVINNILATVNLLELCCANKVRKFVYASSAYVMSNMGGFYRTSKKACEDFVRDYHESRGLDYAILRFGSLYGPRSNIRNGVYRLCKRLLEAEGSYTHEGAADEYREYINVADAARLSVDIIEKDYPRRTFMITGLEKYRMSELVQMVEEIIGKKIPVTYTTTPEGHYKMTPYNYTTEEGLKLVSNPYRDMGQGILNMIHEIKANG